MTLLSTRSTSFEWENAYLHAVRETGDAHVAHRIRDAERAMRSRMIILSNNVVGAKELAHIEMALSRMAVLKQERIITAITPTVPAFPVRRRRETARKIF